MLGTEIIGILSHGIITSVSSVSNSSESSKSISQSIVSESSASMSSCSDSSKSLSSRSVNQTGSLSSKSVSSRSVPSVSSFSSMSSQSSLVSESFSPSPDETIQSRITKNIKAALKLIKKTAGYQYDIVAVEEARKVIDTNGRQDWILILECEPLKDPDSRVIERLKYSVWFFPGIDDELIGDPSDPSRDYDTEVCHYMRNVNGDLAKALNIDTTRGSLAMLTEYLPGEPTNYIDENSGAIMPGTFGEIMVWTNIDAENPYTFRRY